MRESQSTRVLFSTLYFSLYRGEGNGRGSKSRDISSGDRHGARDLEREKTKRLGGLSATPFSHLLVFLFLIAGIARTSSPAHMISFSHKRTLAQQLSRLWVCVRAGFLVTCLDGGKQDPSCKTVAGNVFRIVLLLLLLITTTRHKHTHITHRTYTLQRNQIGFTLASTCSYIHVAGSGAGSTAAPHTPSSISFFCSNRL